jgi:hypothetical protein
VLQVLLAYCCPDTRPADATPSPRYWLRMVLETGSRELLKLLLGAVPREELQWVELPDGRRETAHQFASALALVRLKTAPEPDPQVCPSAR